MDEVLPKIVIQTNHHGICWRLAGGKLDCTNLIFIQTGLKMAGTLAGAELCQAQSSAKPRSQLIS